MNKKLKVLVSAYACKPNLGSEYGVGWNWVKQIARFNEVWAITCEDNKKDIKKFLEKNSLENVHWIFFDIPSWLQTGIKKGKLCRIHYILWQMGAYFACKKINKKIGFDIVHHVTYVNYWMIIFMQLIQAPFIWGPVGGGESCPKKFIKTFSFRNKTFEYSRIIARWIGEHNPLVRIAAKNSKIAFATTPETEKRLKSIGCRNVKIHTQVAASKEELDFFDNITKLNPSSKEKQFTFVSVGRILHWKGFDLGLKAFAKLQNIFPESKYIIIGDGAEKNELKKLVKKLKLSRKVHFYGNMERKDALKEIAKCDALVHPSLHESGGFVCLEAMALEKPVICLDLGGPALQVTEETGIKIKAKNPKQTINDLSTAMFRLATNPYLCRKMGKAGCRRIKKYFNWDKKGEEINRTYHKILIKNQ